MLTHDVIIVGRGMTSLSTALHLKRHGIKSICIIAPDRGFANCASLNAGYASVTLHDNISRMVHGHGSKVASELLRLNHKGYTGLLNEAHDLQIPCHEGQVQRVSASAMETREMEVASTWLRSHGFPSNVDRLSSARPKLTFQSDGAASASLEIGLLLERIESTLGFTSILDSVEQIKPVKDHVIVRTSVGTVMQSQLVVAAGHIGIKPLLPQLKTCLVNHADQWSEFDYIGQHPLIEEGNLIFADFGQFWISVLDGMRIRAGGARYLRKWAGVEAEQATVDPRITDAVRQRIEKVFSLTLSGPRQEHGLLDLRACDEIPIIGPMYDDSRILVGSGYMGSGLTLGFAAGSGLADFIVHGKSRSIPEVFHPKRLRSLPDVP